MFKIFPFIIGFRNFSKIIPISRWLRSADMGVRGLAGFSEAPEQNPRPEPQRIIARALLAI